MSKPLNCATCTLSGKIIVPNKLGGNLILFVGEAVASQEVEQGEPFVGKAGKILKQTLEFVGIPLADVSFANSARCFPQNPDGSIRKPT